MRLYAVSALSQLEASFPEARSIAYLSVSYKEFMRFGIFRVVLSVFNFMIFVQIFSCFVIAVTGS